MTTYRAIISNKVTDERALDRIINARTALVLDHPFYGRCALALKLVEDRSCQTMWTDGVHMGYNPDFVATLSDQELIAVVAHEGSHCVAGHVWRRNSREPRKWNIACDYAINPLIKAGGFDLPKCGLLNPAYEGMSAEAIYGKLPDPPPSGGGKGGKPDAGDALDEVRDAPNPQEVEADWKVTAAQAVKIAKMMGNVPAGIEQFVDEMLKPKLPWRELLRRFCHAIKADDLTWRRPNRRHAASDIYLPSLHSETTPPMVVVIDTSGSTGEHQEQFGREMKSIVEEVLPEKTVVIYCDCRVQKVVEFERGEFVTEHFKGSGGTSFVPPFQHVEGMDIEPACLIYLTDLEGDFPSPPAYPTLWVSTTDKTAPFGETIQLDD